MHNRKDEHEISNGGPQQSIRCNSKFKKISTTLQ